MLAFVFVLHITGLAGRCLTLASGYVACGSAARHLYQAFIQRCRDCFPSNGI